MEVHACALPDPLPETAVEFTGWVPDASEEYDLGAGMLLAGGYGQGGLEAITRGSLDVDMLEQVRFQAALA